MPALPAPTTILNTLTTTLHTATITLLHARTPRGSSGGGGGGKSKTKVVVGGGGGGGGGEPPLEAWEYAVIGVSIAWAITVLIVWCYISQGYQRKNRAGATIHHPNLRALVKSIAWGILLYPIYNLGRHLYRTYGPASRGGSYGKIDEAGHLNPNNPTQSNLGNTSTNWQGHAGQKPSTEESGSGLGGSGVGYEPNRLSAISTAPLVSNTQAPGYAEQAQAMGTGVMAPATTAYMGVGAESYGPEQKEYAAPEVPQGAAAAYYRQ